VAKFRYFGMTVTNLNLIHEEIKSRLHLDNAFYHLVQKLLSYCLLSKNVKIRIYKTIFFLNGMCRYCVNRRFGGKYRFHLQGRRKSASEEPVWAGANRINLKSYIYFSCCFVFVWNLVSGIEGRETGRKV
jgi:hypothetical protein